MCIRDRWITVKRLVMGYGIGLVMGIPLGMLCSRFQLMQNTLGLVSLGFQALPSVCWVPLATLWFGQTEGAMLFVVIMGTLWSVILATANGMRNVPPIYARAARTMGAGPIYCLIHVTLPASAPFVVSGMKQGWAFAWRSLMAAEIFVPILTGFGFLMGDNGRYVGIDQVGIVELGDDVDVGANTTIDRARFGRTIVGEGTKIDNLIQLGHNVVVGKHCVIVAQSGIAGSTKVGDYATIAAQVGISGHLKIGSKSVLGAKTGVISDIPENVAYWGFPASPFKDASRQYAALKKLPALIKEVHALKRNLESPGK